jgi:hypothetical protein
LALGERLRSGEGADRLARQVQPLADLSQADTLREQISDGCGVSQASFTPFLVLALRCREALPDW